MRKYAPRPGWLLTIAASLGLTLTLFASYWQFEKAASKALLQAEYTTRQAAQQIDLNDRVPSTEIVANRKVRVDGVYAPTKVIYLDNRIRNGIAGYEVIVPLRISGSERFVLVNRGWVARGRSRSDVPAVAIPEQQVTVTGTAVIPDERVLELSEATIEGRIWQNLLLSRFRDIQHIDIVDFVLEESSARQDGSSRNGAVPDFGIEKNKIYGVQWLLFAALILFLYVYYGYVREKSGTRK
jgi:surfeit locus 1 family protein